MFKRREIHKVVFHNRCSSNCDQGSWIFRIHFLWKDIQQLEDTLAEEIYLPYNFYQKLLLNKKDYTSYLHFYFSPTDINSKFGHKVAQLTLVPKLAEGRWYALTCVTPGVNARGHSISISISEALQSNDSSFLQLYGTDNQKFMYNLKEYQ